MSDNYVNSLAIETLLDTKSFRTQATVQNTVAGTILFTVLSEMAHIFTGTTAGQILRLPDATTLLIGHRFEFWNLSTQDIVVKNNTPITLVTILKQRRLTIILQSNSSAAGTWAYIQSDVDPSRSTSGVTPPFIFSKSGGVGVGAYLKTGEVLTSNTGQFIKGSNFIVEIKASTSALQVNPSGCNFQFQRRTGLNTFVDIVGAVVNIPSGAYQGTNTGLAVPEGADWELACYNAGPGSATDAVAVMFLIPQ